MNEFKFNIWDEPLVIILLKNTRYNCKCDFRWLMHVTHRVELPFIWLWLRTGLLESACCWRLEQMSRLLPTTVKRCCTLLLPWLTHNCWRSSWQFLSPSKYVVNSDVISWLKYRMGIYTYIPVVKEEVPSLFLPWLTILKYLVLYRKRKPHQLSKDSNLCYGSRLLFKFKNLLFY